MGCGCKGGQSKDTKPKEDMKLNDYVKKALAITVYTIVMILISPIAFIMIWFVGMNLISGDLTNTIKKLKKLSDSLKNVKYDDELDTDFKEGDFKEGDFELVGVKEIKK